MESHKWRNRHSGTVQRKKIKTNFPGTKKLDESLDFMKLIHDRHKKKSKNKNDQIDLLMNSINYKPDLLPSSPKTRITYSSGRRRRPASKTHHKRTSTSIPSKKRGSRPKSMRREDIIKQYLGSKLLLIQINSHTIVIINSYKIRSMPFG